MDSAISDILASVTRAHHVSTSAGSDNIHSLTAVDQHRDLELLTKAWVSERVAPELLPYPGELMERTMQRIREQISTIEDRTARMDAGTSFSLVVIQTELERFKFLVRSFLRARMAKIDAHPEYLLALSNEQSSLSSSSPLLSAQESQYLQAHAALLERHYTSSFLSVFPPGLRRLDDKAGAGVVGMVEGPDVDKAVFVRCLGSSARMNGIDKEINGNEDSDLDRVDVSCGFTREPSSIENRDERDRNEERIISMRRGDVWILRWSSVKEVVLRGECELI